jgi:hypothetical protein
MKETGIFVLSAMAAVVLEPKTGINSKRPRKFNKGECGEQWN